MVRRIVAFLAAAVLVVVLGSAAHSLMVQEAWLAAVALSEGANAALPMSDRLAWVAHDVVAMETRGSVPYGLLTGIALLIAFLVAGLVARFTGLRTLVFAGAGAVAMFVLFTALQSALGTVGVFGARGTLGLGLQMAAGLIAGLLFAHMSKPARS